MNFVLSTSDTLHTLEVLAHLIASTDLDVVALAVAIEVTLQPWAINFTILVHSLNPGVKMGTWHMRRSGFVNVKH